MSDEREEKGRVTHSRGEGIQGGTGAMGKREERHEDTSSREGNGARDVYVGVEDKMIDRRGGTRHFTLGGCLVSFLFTSLSQQFLPSYPVICLSFSS